MIRILTGPIRSHKTTLLLKWVSGRDDCGGVLSPDKDGLRQLYNIKDRSAIQWQKQEVNSPSDVVIGRFVFNSASFDQAIVWLDQHLIDSKIKYLLLDEVGPLELSGGGWDRWISKSLKQTDNKTLILVVREGLIEKVVDHYRIDEYEVVTSAYFFV